MPIDEKFAKKVLTKMSSSAEDAPPTGVLKREGPDVRVTVNITCSGCVHHTAEKWEIEDGNDYDWGFYNFCALLPGIKRDDDRTPEQCPFLNSAVEKLAEGTDENR